MFIFTVITHYNALNFVTQSSFFDSKTFSKAINKFRVETYVKIISHLDQRFSANSQLIVDIQYFIPKNVNLVASMSNIALTYLSKVSNISKDKHKSES